MLRLINRVLRKYFKLELTTSEREYLDDVVITDNLYKDLFNGFISFMFEHQGSKSSCQTRSRVRLHLAKIIEKHIINGSKIHDFYTINVGTYLNSPESINNNNLFGNVYVNGRVIDLAIQPEGCTETIHELAGQNG